MLRVSPVRLRAQPEGERRGLLFAGHGQVHRDGAGLAQRRGVQRLLVEAAGARGAGRGGVGGGRGEGGRRAGRPVMPQGAVAGLK